jgi:hypothetical protein
MHLLEWHGRWWQYIYGPLPLLVGAERQPKGWMQTDMETQLNSPQHNSRCMHAHLVELASGERSVIAEIVSPRDARACRKVG